MSHRDNSPPGKSPPASPSHKTARSSSLTAHGATFGVNDFYQTFVIDYPPVRGYESRQRKKMLKFPIHSQETGCHAEERARLHRFVQGKPLSRLRSSGQSHRRRG